MISSIDSSAAARPISGSERGVSYYAMQYIEGRNLAEVIRELRQLDGLDPAVPETRPAEPEGVSFALATGLFEPCASIDIAT